MRRVLLIGVVILVLAGLRHWALQAAELRVDGQVAHRVMSTGWGLPGGLRARPEGLGAIWIGRQWFVPDDGADGLRVAATTLGGEVLDFFNYDLTRAGGVRQFGHHCRTREVGTVLSLALRGSMRNDDPEMHDLLELICDELGARAAPLDLETASWALVVRRTRTGWVRLGEGASRSRGIVLTVPLTDRTDPIDMIEDAGEGPVQVVSWIARRRSESRMNRIRMAAPLRHGTCDILRWGLGVRAKSGALPFELEVGLGSEPRFECTLVLGPAPRAGQAEFVLRVDGVVVARREVVAGTKEVSEPWRVDLAEYGGQEVELQLSLEASGIPWAAAATPLILSD